MLNNSCGRYWDRVVRTSICRKAVVGYAGRSLVYLRLVVCWHLDLAGGLHTSPLCAVFEPSQRVAWSSTGGPPGSASSSPRGCWMAFFCRLEFSLGTWSTCGLICWRLRPGSLGKGPIAHAWRDGMHRISVKVGTGRQHTRSPLAFAPKKTYEHARYP